MGGGAYLHNVGKRRNSTAPEMTFRHTLQVISTWRRVADVAQRNHFRLAGPEILANPWTPVSIPLRCEKARIDPRRYLRVLYSLLARRCLK